MHVVAQILLTDCVLKQWAFLKLGGGVLRQHSKKHFEFELIEHAISIYIEFIEEHETLFESVALNEEFDTKEELVDPQRLRP